MCDVSMFVLIIPLFHYPLHAVSYICIYMTAQNNSYQYALLVKLI